MSKLKRQTQERAITLIASEGKFSLAYDKKEIKRIETEEGIRIATLMETVADRRFLEEHRPKDTLGFSGDTFLVDATGSLDMDGERLSSSSWPETYRFDKKTKKWGYVSEKRMERFPWYERMVVTPRASAVIEYATMHPDGRYLVTLRIERYIFDDPGQPYGILRCDGGMQVLEIGALTSRWEESRLVLVSRARTDEPRLERPMLSDAPAVLRTQKRREAGKG